MDLAPSSENGSRRLVYGRRDAMRRIVMLATAVALTAGAYGCGGETRTIVRKETTTSVPAPVVLEKRTIIEPVPEVQEQRVYQERERRTIITDD
jgi:hypothetical protein